VVVGPTGWGDAVPAEGDGVVLAGAVDGAVLAALYRRARLVVYVPLLEGFGLPAVEAMAAGTPVVASTVPSTGGAAWNVDPTDEDAIADGLAQVATDEAVRSQLQAAGTARAATLTWERSARQHLAAWETLGV
jgi:glycosyltransferase involved in cell wall biosynthesis